ncbi:helix-turn-helix domain-containing protein [Luteolibacter sp. AS25]|uniref:helix-turn-helix domain-containing protein n=1 Tax=Luteolibacter sp. AS25 TaxID=3135776 RepID=UPI00398B5D17
MSLQSDHENATHLLEALKGILKERRLGYQTVADSLNLSLPTVKRMLNKASIPLNRLMAICRLADTPLAEVFAQAENKRGQVFHFNIS